MVLPLSAALPAAADGAGAGTVVQTGPVPTLVNGSSTPAELHFDATLPAGTTGTVRARLDLPDQWPGGGYYPWRVAADLEPAQCSANGGAFVPCTWYNSGPGTDDGSEIFLDLPTVQAAPTVHYDVKVRAKSHFLPSDQDITGKVLLTAADSGAALAEGPLTMHYDWVAAPYQRTALYAVDKSGVLWQYRSTPDTPFEPRIRIGGGWQVYDLITKANPTTAAGTGDLVARDRSGVLWYYKGTGDPARPFAPRFRVGGGWGQYTAITGAGTGLVALLARDASGHLWAYEQTSDPARPFAPRVLAGWGWNIYNLLAIRRDGVLGRDSSGVLWAYDQSSDPGSQPFGPRKRVGGGWQIYNRVVSPGDIDADYVEDVVARDGAGKLWLYRGTLESNVLSSRTLIGGGWQIYTMLF
jgi:hypothetical protein